MEEISLQGGTVGNPERTDPRDNGRPARLVRQRVLEPMVPQEDAAAKILLSKTRVEDPVYDRFYTREGDVELSDADDSNEGMNGYGNADTMDADGCHDMDADADVSGVCGDEELNVMTVDGRVPLGTPDDDVAANSSGNSNLPPDVTAGYIEPLLLKPDQCHFPKPPESNGIISRLKLLQLCENTDVHLGFHDEIINTIKEWEGDIHRDSRPRATFLKELDRTFPGVPKATAHVIGLENDTLYSQELPEDYRRGARDEATVVTLDFWEQMKDILNDIDIFGDLNNLVVNDQDRWQGYLPKQGDDGSFHYLDEINDGTWYQESYSRLEIDPNSKNQFLLPFALYVDKTGTSHNQRQGLEPVMIIPTICVRRIRNQSCNWRCIGYLPDLDASSKAFKADGSTTFKKSVSRICMRT